MAIWPGSLPPAPLQQGYQRTGKQGLIRSAVEVGPAKVRRRTTAAVEQLQLSFRMTHAQVTAFRTFVDVTLGGGVERFDFTDPIGGGLLVCRFAGGAGEPPYAMAYASPGMMIVTMLWEIMPV